MVFVLVMTVFFWSSTDMEPRVATVMAPSVEACVAAAPKLKAGLEADHKVRLARWVCLAVSGDANAV